MKEICLISVFSNNIFIIWLGMVNMQIYFRDDSTHNSLLYSGFLASNLCISKEVVLFVRGILASSVRIIWCLDDEGESSLS